MQSIVGISSASTPLARGLQTASASINAQTPSFRDGFKQGFCEIVGAPGNFARVIYKQTPMPQGLTAKNTGRAARIGADISYVSVTLPAALVAGLANGAFVKILSKMQA